MDESLEGLTMDELAAQEEGLFLSLMAHLVPPDGWPELLIRVGRHRAIVEELVRRWRATQELVDRVILARCATALAGPEVSDEGQEGYRLALKAVAVDCDRIELVDELIRRERAAGIRPRPGGLHDGDT